MPVTNTDESPDFSPSHEHLIIEDRRRLIQGEAPLFSLYKKKKLDFDIDDLHDSEKNTEHLDIILGATKPDIQSSDWEHVCELLDEGDYFWVEENVEHAPEFELCSNRSCNATVQTFSKKRLEEKRATHHIATGH